MHEVPDWAARWCYIWTHIMFYNVFPLNKKQKQKFHEEQLKICKKGLNQHQTIRRLSIPPRDELTPDLNHSTWSEYFISAHPSRLKRPPCPPDNEQSAALSFRLFDSRSPGALFPPIQLGDVQQLGYSNTTGTHTQRHTHKAGKCAQRAGEVFWSR